MLNQVLFRMQWRLSMYLILVGSLQIPSAFSQTHRPQPIFTHYTVEDGLPSSEIHHVMQDSKGYMWFATNLGVSRFDGYNFKNYSLRQGLPDNTIFNIYEDFLGRIWFISFSGRLSYFEDGQIKPYKYSDALEKEVTNLYKGSFHIDKNNQLFIGPGTGHGYLKIDALGNITHHGLDSSYFTGLVNLEGELFVYSRQKWSGPSKFAIVTHSDTAFIEVDNVDKRTNFQGILLSDNNILFTSGRTAISFSTQLTSKIYSLPHDALSSLEDLNQNIWIGTYQGGVRYYKNGIDNANSRTYLDGLSITSIVQDAEGGMWFTTLEQGLYYLSSIDFLTYNIASGLDAEMITCVTADQKNTLYAGLKDGSIYYFSDSSISKNIPIPSLAPAILSLYYDTVTSQLWIGASAKDAIIDTKGIHLLNGYGGTHEIMKSSDGSMWMGNHRRLRNLINQEIVYSSEFHLKAFRITALHESISGVIWVGNLHGLWKFQDSSFVSAHEANPTLRYAISDINEINGELCISTKGVGLLILSADSIVKIDQTSGLASDNLSNILVDGSDIWVGSNRGINRISFKEDNNFNYEISSYSVLDGLASNEVNQIIKFRNQIWVATNKGLTFFNPNELSEHKYEPKMYINKVSIMNRDTSIMNSYDLVYYQNQIEINYIGISYKNAGQLYYRVKLEGIDTGWVYTNNTSVRYTSIPPGFYTFSVSARTESGQWTDNLAPVKIDINPPFWKTWWFAFGMALTAIAAVLAFFKIRILTYNRDVVRELMIAFLNLFRKTEFLVEKVGSSVVKINISTILWIKASDNYVEIVTKDKKYLVRSTLDKMHQKLPLKRNFLKVHRSYIIHLPKVQSLEKSSIKINNEAIPISDSFTANKELVKDHLLLLNK